MRYAVVFAVLAAYLAALAAVLGGAGWLLLWPAVSFALVAVAYATGRPRLLGKRADGRFATWAWPLLLPFFVFAWTAWHLQRRFSRQPGSHEVAPRLWVGRRPFAHEIPANVNLIVDLTAEFAPARRVCTGRAYRCLPTLDGLTPDLAAVRELLAEVAAWPGPVLIHCANGHGRSALLAAAVLLARGAAPDPAAAVELLRQARPGVRLNRGQRAALERLAAGLKAAGQQEPGAEAPGRHA